MNAELHPRHVRASKVYGHVANRCSMLTVENERSEGIEEYDRSAMREKIVSPKHLKYLRHSSVINEVGFINW